MRALRALSIVLVASTPSWLLGCSDLPEDGTPTGAAIKGGGITVTSRLRAPGSWTEPRFPMRTPATENRSVPTWPALEWANAPQHTKSFALVFKDISLTEGDAAGSARLSQRSSGTSRRTRTACPRALPSTEFLDEPPFARQWSRQQPSTVISAPARISSGDLAAAYGQLLVHPVRARHQGSRLPAAESGDPELHQVWDGRLPGDGRHRQDRAPGHRRRRPVGGPRAARAAARAQPATVDGCEPARPAGGICRGQRNRFRVRTAGNAKKSGLCARP